MTYSTPETVVSGVPYRVLEVNPPGMPGRGSAGPEQELSGGLDRFVGPATFVVQGRTGRHTVSGEGTADGHAVRFHEKDVRADGKDVRVWRLYHAEDASLVAEPLAATG